MAWQRYLLGLIAGTMGTVWAQPYLSNWAIEVTPAYVYYASIDAIHSTYRYEGQNVSIGVTGERFADTRMQRLSLFYGWMERHPDELPANAYISLQSYDHESETYLWPTSALFLKKKTQLLQQAFDGYYRIPTGWLKGSWFAGYHEEIMVINCPNLPMLELFTLSVGPAARCRIPLLEPLSYLMEVNFALISADIRNSYASVDGVTVSKKDLSYYFDFIKRHTWINGPNRHLAFSMGQEVEYRLLTQVYMRGGYSWTYRRVKLPRELKSVNRQFYFGVRYVW
jgi:hypothetical protein